MPPRQALATAVALADYLETYTSESRVENILRLAETLQALEEGGHAAGSLSPQDLGNLLGLILESLPPEVLDNLNLPMQS